MKHSALVIVRLHGADQEQATQFAEEMARRDWAPYPPVQSSFRVDFEGADSDDDLVDVTEADVTASAEAAYIYDWEGTILLSSET